MSEVLIWNAMIGGVVFGVVYALIGCSLNVLAGVLRVINFAHGEFIIAGSFFAWRVYVASMNWNQLPSGCCIAERRIRVSALASSIEPYGVRNESDL